MSAFALPDLGEGLSEAEIVEWLVQPGDEVASGEPVVLVETDKAQVEVTSPRSGRIARVCQEIGARVAVGATLLEFEGPPARAEDVEAAPSSHVAGVAGDEDAGTVVGSLPRTPGAATTRERPAGASGASGVSGTHDGPGARGASHAAPAVRALAREHGVDLASVAGSGPGGAILSDDVLRTISARSKAAGFEPLRGVRLAMARNMSRAREVVPASVNDEADVEAWAGAADVTVRLARALVSACGIEPALNAWLDAAGTSRRLHQQVDLALAVQTPDGLFAPVIRDAGRLDAHSLREAIGTVHEAAHARSLELADLRDATITLSNFGSMGGWHATLVVVPPQVAILGAGRIAARVVAVEGRPAVHRVLPLSLTFDHRAVTGAEATRFLAAAIDDLERPD